MIAAAGAGMAAIDHEFVGAEPRLPRFLVKRLRGGNGFAPVRGRMDIDLDHAGIGRDFQHIDARIGRRRITFDMHRHFQFGRGRLDRAEQLDIILQPLDRRHEDGHASVARFDRQSRADMHADRDLSPSFAAPRAACAHNPSRVCRDREARRAPRTDRPGSHADNPPAQYAAMNRAEAASRSENLPAAERDARAAISRFR